MCLRLFILKDYGFTVCAEVGGIFRDVKAPPPGKQKSLCLQQRDKGKLPLRYHSSCRAQARPLRAPGNGGGRRGLVPKRVRPPCSEVIFAPAPPAALHQTAALWAEWSGATVLICASFSIYLIILSAQTTIVKRKLPPPWGILSNLQGFLIPFLPEVCYTDAQT